jgi:hypothetical protein
MAALPIRDDLVIPRILASDRDCQAFQLIAAGQKATLRRT